jgi:hypothetical protein
MNPAAPVTAIMARLSKPFLVDSVGLCISCPGQRQRSVDVAVVFEHPRELDALVGG